MNERPESRLERWVQQVTRAVGTGAGFAVALAIVCVWALTGPLFGFSNTWQLVINTGTRIVTFLMAFLIQRAQNKDALSLQLNRVFTPPTESVFEGSRNQRNYTERIITAVAGALKPFAQGLRR